MIPMLSPSDMTSMIVRLLTRHRSHGRTVRPASRRLISRTTVVGAIALTMGCSGLLTVTDPTLVQDSDLANAAGANARRLGVVSQFDASISTAFGQIALFTDERMYDTQFPLSVTVNQLLDTRDTAAFQTYYAGSNDPILGPLTRILSSSSVALPGIRADAPANVRNEYVAHLYALRGFAIVQMAETLCPGFPINDIRDGAPYYSMPFSTDSALRYAVATLDTALAAGHDSTRFLNLARVLKGRALTDLGEWALAAQAVAEVPTDFTYQTDEGYGIPFDGSTFPRQPQAVGNRDGGAGLPFASANDPRVPSVFVQMRIHRTADTVSDSLHKQLKYESNQSPVTVASGVEARLIEAEAALNANDPTTWLTKLNELRDVAIAPVMPHLVDPGSATRVDTMFKERAFWLYLTGHRLGDMRRLIHKYNRAVNTVYPSGTHPLGIPYGPATSIPFIFSNASQYNPHITKGCAPE